MKQANNYFWTTFFIIVISLLLTGALITLIPYIISSNRELPLEKTANSAEINSPTYLDSVKIEVFDTDSTELLKSIYIDTDINSGILAKIEKLWDELLETLDFNSPASYDKESDQYTSLYTVEVTLNYSRSQYTSFNYRADGNTDIWSFGRRTEMTYCLSGSKAIAEYINSILKDMN